MTCLSGRARIRKRFQVSRRILVGWVASATATDPAGNTSEFATCIPFAKESAQSGR
jgi:hypothetical protein